MKPFSTFRLLLATATFLVLAITLSSFITGKTSRYSSLPATPASPVFADDDYYKIPDSASYRGQPMNNKSGPLSLSTELGQNYYIVNDTAHNTGFLYAEIKADDFTPATKQRSPLNLALVIDRSGSMAGNKLAYAKKAADFLIDKLNDKDMLSIVVYESGVGVLQKPVYVTDKKYLHDVIDNIVVAGGTNLSGGMIAGYEQVKASYKPGYVNRVLLLSDGLANEGITNTEQLKGIAKKWFNTESISISTFGIGNDYNEDLMTALAENGGGNYYYIKEPSQIPALFEKEINGLLKLVARQATLAFSLPPQINVLRVYGGNYEMDKNIMTVRLKDIFALETKAVLIKFKIKPGTNTDIPVATHLQFEDATDKDQVKEIANLNVMKPVSDPKVYMANFSERVMQQCTMFESNDLLEKTMKAVDDRDYDKARKLGSTAESYLWSNKSKVSYSPEMQKQDSVVTKYNKELKTVEIRSAEEMKEMQKVNKSANYMIRGKK